MTVDNCIKRYKKYIACGNTAAAANTKAHMLAGRKFKAHAEYPFDELFGVKKKEAPKKEEVKKDGKKPKR